MPHIIVDACDTDRNIQYIKLHADIKFRIDYYQEGSRFHFKVDELEHKMIDLLEEYFPGKVESEIFSNHEYNTRHGLY